jgi:citrate lyase gamma subunit
MRRIGLTAAGLLAMVTIALALVTSGRARPNLAIHTCSATDRQFIETARTNMTALGLWSEQYESGDAGGAELVTQARAGAKIVRATGPTDSSLQQTQRLLVGMLTEYARAVQLQDRHDNAGPHMYRAYGLANYAHTVLMRAEQPLFKLGCDIRPLL